MIRLWGITNPPLEVAHSWRQTTVCMVARNFIEVDANPFYPRIDIAGEKSGITGMEFPVLNYLIFLFAKVFGYQHWYGRLINLMISTIGIFYFFKLVKRYFDKELAFNASIILITSIWFAYSRKIMPDTFASSLAIMSIYYGSAYFENKSKYINILLYFVFGLLSILSKLPVIFLFSIFVLFVFQNKYSVKSRILFVISSIIILIPIYWWYWIWVPYLVREFDFWHFFMGKSIRVGFNEIFSQWPLALKLWYADAIKYIAFVFFILGLFFIIKNKKLIALFTVLLISFLAIVFSAGNTFVRHSYYIIPYVPIMAIISAYGLQQLRNQKLIMIINIIISIEGIANQFQDFYIHDNGKAIINLEADLDQFCKPNDLITINSNANPAPMYFAHRKGFIASNNQLIDSSFINSIRNSGCKYIIILKQNYGTEVELQQELLLENKDYNIYRIKN